VIMRRLLLDLVATVLLLGVFLILAAGASLLVVPR
jgi:hypothetical protein